jgi:hypothetical protein
LTMKSPLPPGFFSILDLGCAFWMAAAKLVARGR